MVDDGLSDVRCLLIGDLSFSPFATTLHLSPHAFSLLPRFLSPIFCHTFQLLPPPSSTTVFTSGLSTWPVEVRKVNVLPKGNLVT